jgi:hypothetical protein
MESHVLNTFGTAGRNAAPDSAGFYLQCGRHISRCTYRPTHGFESNPPNRGGGKRFVTYPSGAIRVPFGEAERIVDSLDSAKAYLTESVAASDATFTAGEGVTLVHGHPSLNAINAPERLYVIKSGGGYSCNGFDYQARIGEAVAAWLGDPDLIRAAHVALIGAAGSPSAFDFFRDLMERGRKHAEATGDRCEAELSPALKGLEGKRVEVTTPSGETSRFTVGRSTGWLPIHLEIKRRDSSGGGVYVPDGSSVRVL